MSDSKLARKNSKFLVGPAKLNSRDRIEWKAGLDGYALLREFISLPFVGSFKASDSYYTNVWIYDFRPPRKGKKKKTGQKVMNDLLEQVPLLPITPREYMPKKVISHKDDKEGDEEIQHFLCDMIRVTEANEKKETKAMSEKGPSKTNQTNLHLEPLDEKEEDIQIWALTLFPSYFDVGVDAQGLWRIVKFRSYRASIKEGDPMLTYRVWEALVKYFASQMKSTFTISGFVKEIFTVGTLTLFPSYFDVEVDAQGLWRIVKFRNYWASIKVGSVVSRVELVIFSDWEQGRTCGARGEAAQAVRWGNSRLATVLYARAKGDTGMDAARTEVIVARADESAAHAG
ncbi:hypothetical protein TEA_001771 [Camellia sinensis var. sinensis]|uniref:Uncharacterized protein n=1 Tax=Camellia sinensis var. sinensis TaxID=542762 RepID=A0A4S4D8P0_CAMSN|nr:hypothetical protein TEA_001771 [Camellia sinensis var. sinensis]